MSSWTFRDASLTPTPSFAGVHTIAPGLSFGEGMPRVTIELPVVPYTLSVVVPFDGSVRPSAALYRLSTTVTQYGGCSAARYSADLVELIGSGSAVAAESPWEMGAVTYFFSVMILVG